MFSVKISSGLSYLNSQMQTELLRSWTQREFILFFMLWAATWTQCKPCCVTCDWDKWVFFTSLTENRCVSKIHLPFTWEKSYSVFHQDDPNLLCSPQRLYTLYLKAVAWKKVIRSMMAAPQGIIIVTVYCMVKNYLVTVAWRCQENSKWISFYKWQRTVCLLSLLSPSGSDLSVFCGSTGRFLDLYPFRFTFILQSCSCKIPSQALREKFIKKHRQSGKLFFFLLKAQPVPYERIQKLYVCVCV